MKTIIQKIRQKIIKYDKAKSPFSKITDLLFLILIIVLIIPATRKPLVVSIKKLSLLQPRISSESKFQQLSESDYDWIFQTPEGELISFADYKGKVVFLNFWATYCPSCIAEFSSINNLYKDYQQDVSFILISNERPANIRKFLDKSDFQTPFYLTYQNLPEVFSSRLIPSTYLISSDGRLVVQKTGSAKWDGPKVRSLLDQMIGKD